MILTGNMKMSVECWWYDTDREHEDECGVLVV
jgi:hypothetical protein